MIRIADQKEDDSNTALSHKGRVTHLGVEKDKIRSVIDLGISVSILMSKSEYDLHRLCLNDSIVFNFNIDGITIL